MRTVKLITILALVPSLGLAQASAQAGGQTQTGGGVSAGRTRVAATSETRMNASVQNEDVARREKALRGLSAEGRARAEAMLEVAQQNDLPEDALVGILLEGQAKGATEAQLLRAEEQTMTRLTLSREALVRAGRPEPSDEEVSRGAGVLAKGATSTQLEALVRRSPPDRSLSATLTAVTELTARGVPLNNALAEVGGTTGAGAQVRPSGLDASASTSGTATGSAGQVSGRSSTGIGVTATVGEAIGR